MPWQLVVPPEPEQVEPADQPDSWELIANLRGPQGPAGAPFAIVHEQATPTASWLISHEFGRLPTVTLYVDGELVEADVDSDTHTTTVVFPTPTVGIAVLV